MRTVTLRTLSALCLLASWSAAGAQQAVPLDFSRAHWVGAADVGGAVIGFRRTFELAAAPLYGTILATADPSFELLVNGAKVGGSDDWTAPMRFDVARHLRAGTNVIAARVTAQQGGRNALLLAFRALTPDGAVLEFSSDAQWQVQVQPAEGFAQPGFDAKGWAAATDRGAYGATPWGRLTRLSAVEALRAMSEVQLTVPAESGQSSFAGKYAQPLDAERYRSYVTVDRANGRFRVNGKQAAMLFVRYSQPGFGYDRPALRAQDLDFDVFEADLAVLARNGLQVALQGFSWSDLLAADGTWLKLTHQPKGSGLPAFQFAYQVLDYALDRVQERGLSAMVLLDYSKPLPGGAVPDAYADKVFFAAQLWDGVIRGQAKICRYFADRPVIAGWCLEADALPAWPARTEPLLTQAFRDYLRQRYGSVDGLRAQWGGAAPADLDRVTLPSDRADDPSAADFGEMMQAVTLQRLNQWADALRNVAPHHLLAFGDPVAGRALLEPQRLRFDLYGPFGLHPAAVDPAAGSAPPSPAPWAFARSVRALPKSTIAATLGGRFGAGSVGPWAGRAVLHEWADCVADGAAGLITAPTWDRLTARGGGSATVGDSVTVTRLGAAVEALQKTYLIYPPRVLVVRNDAGVLANDSAPDVAGVDRLAEALERLHIPYDVVAASAVGGPEESYRTDLARYRAVMLPTLRRVPGDGFWSALDRWLSEAPNGERLLVVGRVDTNRPLTALAAKLLGTSAVQKPVAAEAGGSLLVNPPISALPAGRQLAWPRDVPVNVLPAADGGRVLATLRGASGDGPPVLTERKLAGGTRLVMAGFNLGAGEASALSASDWDSLFYVVRGLLNSADITAPIQAASTLGVHVSEDGATALAIERAGERQETLWTTVASRPESVWAGAETRLDGNGNVTVSAPLAPYQVKLFDAVAEIHGVDAGEKATVRAASQLGEGVTLSAQGPEGMALQVRTVPQGNYTVRVANGLPQPGRADADGVATVELADSKPVTVQVYGNIGPPSPIAAAADYVALADTYVQRREIDKAFAELGRLSAQYPGTDVARLADTRRAALLARCGVLVLVNETAKPVLVSYLGAQSAGGVVEPGRDKRFVLYSGSYQESVKVVAPEGGPALDRLDAPPPPQPTAVTVAAGTAEVREWTGGSGQAPDLSKLVRSPLSGDEKTALMVSAKAYLGVAEGPAAAAPTAPGAGGAGATPPVAAVAKALVLPEVQVIKGGKDAKVCKVMVRNRTGRVVLLRVRYRPPEPMKPIVYEQIVEPRKSGTMELQLQGSYYFYLGFPETDQALDLAEFKADGSSYQISLTEYSQRQYDQKVKQLRRKGVLVTEMTDALGAAKPTLTASESSENAVRHQTPASGVVVPGAAAGTVTPPPTPPAETPAPKK